MYLAHVGIIKQADMQAVLFEWVICVFSLHTGPFWFVSAVICYMYFVRVFVMIYSGAFASPA